MSRCRRRYVDGPHGQIHVRTWAQDGRGDSPPLLCLHPTPFGGLFFDPLAPLLTAGRQVLAPDYPGYGGSDAPTEPPSITDYAEAMGAVIDDLDSDGPVDLFGLHTG